MLNNRLIVILIGAALLMAAGFISISGTGTSTVLPNQVSASSNLMRQPSGEIALANVQASDYYQRHPGLAIAVEGVATDWFQRHPQVTSASTVADWPDYYQRHSVSLILGAGGANDYFQRHPELLETSGTSGASDWFQRHPGALSQ